MAKLTERQRRDLAKLLVVDFVGDRFPDPLIVGRSESDGDGGYAVTLQILVSDLDIDNATAEEIARVKPKSNGGAK